MSIDLDWSQLDQVLCARALASINNVLRTTDKPAFLGDVEATSFSFGTAAPEFEILQIRDVYEEFLNIEDDDEDEDGYEGTARVSGRGFDDQYGHTNDGDSDGPGKPNIPLSPTASFGAFPTRPLGTPSLYSSQHQHAGLWMSSYHHSRKTSQASSSNANLPSLAAAASAVGGGGAGLGQSTPLAGYPFPRISAHQQDLAFSDRRSNTSSSAYLGARRDISPSGNPPPDPNADVAVQVHLRVKYHGNLSIAFETALRVNYPSFAFMSLPLALRLSGLAFEGTLVVAYEGDKKRLHVSILDDDDRTKVAAGHRLLRSVRVESEVGQADKLVLKDVEKVEQFVLDAARKALQVSVSVSLGTAVPGAFTWHRRRLFGRTDPV